MKDIKEIEISAEQREKLEAAFLNAFTHDSLKHMLRLKMGIKIGEELNIDRGLKYVVPDLIDIAISSGWLRRLLLAAREYKPGNHYLKNIVNELQIFQPEGMNKVNIDVNNDVQSNQGLLEKIIRKRAPFIPFEKYTTALLAIGRQMARIEIPAGTAEGTGWLVGPNLLLTAYHVIENVHRKQNGLDHQDLSFRFDYTNATGPSRSCGATEDWLIDYSPYSDHDLEITGQEPSPAELDYALIRLADNAGDDLRNGQDSRGWIEIPEHPIAMSPQDFVVIPQHPDGRPLELAFGEILKYNKASNRVQYDTNTEYGSSGSPCFDISLQPFALHHAQGPAKNLAYNQGVPLREIIKLMKQRNVTPFWKKNV